MIRRFCNVNVHSTFKRTIFTPRNLIAPYRQALGNSLTKVSCFKALSRRMLWIQSEVTPNEHALKFFPGRPIMANDQQDTKDKNKTLEFLSIEETKNAPLARKLFQLEGVVSIMYGSDFVTIEKSSSFNWANLKPEIYSAMAEFYSQDRPAYIINENNSSPQKDGEGPMCEIEEAIKELLDLRIRPSIQEDGGDVEFRGFDSEKGIVKLKLQGACRSCSSSSITLKNGIENMLKHYIPEVNAVEQIADPLEEHSNHVFEEFEKKLK